MRATLEAIVAAPEAFPRDVTPRVGLYSLFETLWQASHDAGGDDALVAAARERSMPINDLWTRVRGFAGGLQLHENVHFSEAGSAALGSIVAGAIRRQLGVQASDRTIGAGDRVPGSGSGPDALG